MKVTNGELAEKGSKEEIINHFCDVKKTNDCPITDVLARISDKWTMHTLIILGKSDKLRFTELKNQVEGISQRMLTVTLRTLEEDGFVTRTIFPQIPPKVEYELTTLGRSLVVELISLSNWANDNMKAVLEARERYILKQN
ncbi:winged helix-turn-helix transcriptional regulator [Daejeonella lutea]|uniref:Transcriptional regulator, HxlR family n=1 Tax=Daejeonella lutea TaxID=572036 RepID=A0A1T5EBD8_9SPHI|nr:helix-turn-helix domain-containing protein [Daejeonella lutea]SKB81149.1 transcriptional regulator, HxlR family [Daejeonella lutea]